MDLKAPLSGVALWALVIGLLASPPARAAGGNVLGYHNDAGSTGQYLSETQLSATNVNSTNFGELFGYPVDGQVYAQPLYMAGVTITTGSNQGAHDVVFVATQHGSLYAFDADGTSGGAPLWQTSFINPANGVTTVPNAAVNSTDIAPEIGITSTPVISASSNTIFVCAKTQEMVSGSTHYILRLHAIDIGSGLEKTGSPVAIADTISNDLVNYTYVSGPTVTGSGDGNVGGQVTFNALRQLQRCALSLVNGVVYFGSGGHGDISPFHGWVIGCSATNYQIVAAWNVDPGGGDAGVWMAGDQICTDGSGGLYVTTGNGTFVQPTYNSPTGTYINGDYGDSFVKLTIDTVHTSSTNQNSNGWGLQVASYFTAFNQAALSGSDYDVGSGGAMLLPNSAGSTAHPHLMVSAGKEGRLYLADRDNMGGYNSVSDPVVQEEASAFHGLFSTPAYFNGAFYIAPAFSNDTAKAFTITSGSFSTMPVVTPDTYGFGSSSPCISGSSATDPNAIVWCLERNGNLSELRAYEAANFSQEIYTSDQNEDRDRTGETCKFAVPTIANGRVYVPTAAGLNVYGLLSAPPAAVPFAPSNLTAESLSPGTVWLSWDQNSNNASGFYIEESTNGTSFSQIASTGSNVRGYPVTALTSGSSYYFRVRSYNTTGDSAYSGTAGATTPAAAPAVDFSSGFAASGSSMAFNTNGVGSVPANTSQLQLVSATNNEAHSAWYIDPVNISTFTTTFDFQVTGTEPLADGLTFAIQRTGTSALGESGASHGFGGIGNGLAIDFGYYGGTYTGLYSGSSTDVTAASGISYHSGDVMRVTLNYNGTTLSESITDLETGIAFSESYALNISGTIGGSTAYIGFTGATGGNNSIQDIYNWTYNTVPPLPGIPVATPNSDTQVTLKWADNASNETGYEVDRANDSGFTVNKQVFNGPAVTTGTGVYVDTGLTGDTTYYYRVSATNTLGSSGYSGTTGVLTFCSAPASPAAVGGTGNVSMAWNASSGAASYDVYRSTGSGGEGATAYLGGIVSTTATDNSATNGTTYYYKVSAVNPSGAGPQSVEFSAKPSATLTFAQWKLQKFGSVLATESAAAADTADPAGDNISNLMKYALGLNPFAEGASGLPTGALATISGTNYLTLTFVRPHPAPGDLTYTVQTTSNLPGGIWTPGVVVSGYPVNNGNGTETMEERSSTPFSSPSEFIQLQVTGP